MQCDKCRRDAIVSQPYSGLHLCPEHFIRDLEAKAKRTVRLHGWLKPGDRTGVVLDGSAGGLALLSFMRKLTGKRRDISLSAIAVDPGPAGGPVTRAAQTIAAACDTPVFVASFADRYGITADEILRNNGKAEAGHICRVLRDDLVAETARDNGMTRCALATSVDDCAGAFFSGMLSGTPEHAVFAYDSVGKLRVPAIRPFIEIPRDEVNRYAALVPEFSVVGGAGFLTVEDSWGASDACRAGRDAELEAFGKNHPATKFALGNLARTLAGIPGGKEGLATCPSCGRPLENGCCPSCDLRKKFTMGRGIP